MEEAMRDFATHTEPVVNDATATKVPATQIHAARETFPGNSLSFEVLLETRAAWQGFDLCAKIARGGYHVTQVSYRENGSLFLRLRDNGAKEPQDLARRFTRNSEVSIVRWTTVISL
jgi:hypothetical protein